jgi:hypothetical protein
MRYSYTAQAVKNSAAQKPDHCTFGHGKAKHAFPLAPLPKCRLAATMTFDVGAQEAHKTARTDSVGGNAGERR